jgi:FkbM family methyltransferase
MERLRLKWWARKDLLLSFMSLHVAPNSIIYDVGAHIGSYSLVLGRKIQNSVIYSFEPNPETYARLAKNLTLMKAGGNIIPKNIALGSDIGRCKLYISSSSGMSSLHEEHAKADGLVVTSTVSVDCYTIDYLVDEGFIKAPDVIKIDVEGHEYEVIKGAQNTIASNSPQIFLEPHEVGEPHKVEDFLARKFGYTCKSLGYPIWCYKEPAKGFE